MKLNFKKIASVLTSTVMLSSTIGLAAAANYPAPFVKGGSADVAIVYGTSAAITDLAAVADIQANLATKLAGQTASTSSGDTSSSTTVEGGDYVKLEKDSNKFNLGEDISDFYSTLTNEELSVVLADSKYWNNVNEDFEYTQEITPLNDAVLRHFADSSFNDEKPVIGFDLTSGNDLLNYTLEFDDAAEGGTDFANFQSTSIDMLGRTFFVSEVEEVSNHFKITLLDAANTATLKESETTEVTVNDQKYDVSVDIVTTSDKVKLNINGEVTPSLAAGDTFPLRDGSFVGITDVSYSEKKDSIVEFSIGTGKIILEHGQEVQINDEDISTFEDANGYTSLITAYIVNSTDENIESITLNWALDDDAWVTKGTELVMPGFNTIKLSMGDFFMPLIEETALENSGDAMVVSTIVKDGAVDLPVLYMNSSASGFEGIGKKTTERLVTNSTTSPSLRLNETQNTYFAATWINGDESETYVYQIDKIDAGSDNKNATTLKNLAADGSDVVFSEVGKDKTVGQIKLTLVAANDDLKTATVKVQPSGASGAVYADRVVTNEGLWFRLPVVASNYSNVADGEIAMPGLGTLNATGGTANMAVTHPTSWVMRFVEENEDEDVATGLTFNATIGIDTSNEGTEVTSISGAGMSMLETEDGSDVEEGYVVSPLATRLVYDNPTSGLNKFTVEYHGGESFADVILAETGAVVSSDGTVSVSTGGAVRELGSVMVTDAEAGSVSSKNVIVVGGSCVNSVAAELLGGKLCGSDFEAKTKAGAGSFVIETFSWKSGKVATLVAGYNAGDTTNAAKYLTSYTVDTMVGKKYLGTSATTATLQTTVAAAETETTA